MRLNIQILVNIDQNNRPLSNFRKNEYFKLDSIARSAYILINNTCHASRQISAPRRVFHFMGVA